MKDPYYITPVSMENNERVLSKLKVGDLLQFSFVYTQLEVKDMILDRGLTPLYLGPGSRVFKIIDREKEIKQNQPVTPVMFDPEMLVI